MPTAPPPAAGPLPAVQDRAPFAPPRRRDEPPLPLPADDEVPQETIDALARGRDALLGLVGAVFRAAAEIVAALLRLVESVAGRGAAEAVDGGTAEALRPLVPREPAPAPPGAAGPALRDCVGAVLLERAETAAERAAVTPAFVDLVTAGVRFAASVERQSPGTVAALDRKSVV